MKILKTKENPVGREKLTERATPSLKRVRLHNWLAAQPAARLTDRAKGVSRIDRFSCSSFALTPRPCCPLRVAARPELESEAQLAESYQEYTSTDPINQSMSRLVSKRKSDPGVRAQLKCARNVHGVVY